MRKKLLSIFTILLIGCSHSKTVFLGEKDFKSFVEKNKSQLLSLKSLGAPISDPLSLEGRKWPVLQEEIMRQKLTQLKKNFHKITQEKNVGNWKFYEIAQRKSLKKTLIIFTTPQSPEWSFSTLLTKASVKFPDYRIILVDSSYALRNLDFSNLDQVNNSFREAFRDYDIKGERHFVALCTSGTLFDRFLVNYKGASSVIYYSPMVNEFVKNLLPSPRLFSKKENFSMEYLVHWYEGLIRENVYVFPFDVRFRRLNTNVWTSILTKYQLGETQIPVGAHSIIALEDDLIPNKNSASTNFISVQKIENAKHLDPLQVPVFVEALLKSIEKITEAH